VENVDFYRILCDGKMYIHEIKNWTSFIWNNDKIVPKLASVRHLQGRLLGRMESLGFDFTERATIRIAYFRSS